MADADVQGLLVRIEATTAQLRQEMSRGEVSVGQAAVNIDRELARIDRAMDETGENAGVLQRAISGAFTGMGIAAGAAVAGLVTITTQAAEYAQEIKNLSALSNTTVTDFQRLAAGAKTVGVEQDKLSDIFKDVNDRVGEFMQRGGGEMSDFFKEIAPNVSVTSDQLDTLSKSVGVTIAHFASLSGPEALQLYYTSLEKSGLNQQQMTTYMEAMADEATALIPLLKNNGQAFKEIGDSAEKAGKVLTAFEVSRLVQADLAIKGLQSSLDGASRQMVLGLLPAIEDVTGRLTEMSKNGAMEILSGTVGFLVENLNVLVALMGGKLAAAFVGYITGLASSTAATYQNRAANIAAAASAVELALANQIAAQSAVIRAEREVVAARAVASGTAIQTQMSIQLAEARMAERVATNQLAAAQATLGRASGGVMALMGGPAGIIALAVGVGIAFLTMGGNAKQAGADLEQLKRPIAELRKEFQALTRDQKEATIVTALRQQEQVAGEAEVAFSDFLKTSRQVLGSSVGTRVASEFEAARKSGGGLSSTLEDLQKRFRIPEEGMRTLKEAAGGVSKLDVATGQAVAKVAAFREELAASIKPTDGKAEADAIAARAAKTYTEELDKQLTKLKDKTAVEQAGTWLTENRIAAESALGKQVLEHAKAIDAQKKADKDATDATNAAASAAKKSASETEAQSKALADLTAQTIREIEAANGMAAAYAVGADKSRELTLQQKVEEALLKTGASARKAVEKAIHAQADAQDKLNVIKAAYDLGKETADLIAQAKAQLAGAQALEAYNLQKSMSVALAGKNIATGSKEYELLLDANKAHQEAVKLAERAESVGGIMDRLYPEAAALREYTAEQHALNAAMSLYPENAAAYQAALVKLGTEYEVNRSKATLWGQMTEGAIDRIDQSFANAWANIGDGANTLWDDLKKGFKQTLGEIMHMLTTKPLLASISNWLTGTDNGQGLGSVWSKLLGTVGGSSGGVSIGGLGGGSLAGIGKSLYQAWSSLTGVGSSIAGGYATGGIGGAVSGGVGYYTSMLSSVGASISSGFSGLMATITGSTAAQTAAIVGAEGVTAASLSVGMEAAAAGYATQFGAITGTVSYAAAESAAAASAAASTSAMMGPLAILMGMYQSGKLYDAGVRYDTSDMQTSKLSQVGRALPGMVGFDRALTFASIGFADRTMSSIFGDKMGAILSGSTLATAVETFIGEKLFGTKWATKDTGMALSVSGGEFNAEDFQYQKKKGGLFGSNKKRFVYGEMADAEMADTLGAAYNSTVLGAMDLFAALNVTLNKAVLDGLNVERLNISTQDRTTEEIQADITAWFTSLGDSAVSAINSATTAGLDGFTFDSLQTFVNNLYSVNASLGLLGVKAAAFSIAGGRIVESLVTAAGDIDTLNTNIAGYYAAFTSETQRANDSILGVRQQFAALGVQLPATEDAFRDMLKAIDVTTEAGRATFTAMTANAESAAQVYAVLQQRQADYYGAFHTEAENTARTIADTTAEIKLLGVTLPGTRAAFRAMVEAAEKDTSTAGKAMLESLLSVAAAAGTVFDAMEATAQAAADAAAQAAQAAADAAAQAAQALAEQLMSSATASFSAVQRAIAAEQKTVTDAYNSRTASFSDMLSTVTANISDLSSISSSLESALKSLNGTSDETVKRLRVQAQATLQSALSKARSGGSLAGFKGLEDALNTVSSNDTGLYGSLEDFNREQGRTANVIAELNALNGKQLSNAEKSVEALQAQIDAAKKAYDLQMAQYDTQLASAQAQLDALNGIDNSVLSVAAAMQAMNAAVVAALSGKEAGSAAQNTYDNNVALLESVYQAVLGRGLDASGKATWTAALANGTVNYADLVDTIATGGRLNGESVKVPGYAAGGAFGGGLRLVGENGPELEVTGPSYIYNANQTAAMLGLGGGDWQSVVLELNELRSELKVALFAIAKHTMKAAKNTDLLPRKLEQELFS